MAKFFVTFSIVFIVLALIALFIGVIRTFSIQSGSEQSFFLGGKVPSNKPEGFYKGSVTGFNMGWRGQKFDRSTFTGVNIMLENGKLVEKYSFKTSVTQGLVDKINVIRIDYNLDANPLWIKFITDEIVETEPGHYMGKMHVTLIPGLPIVLAIFYLDEGPLPQAN